MSITTMEGPGYCLTNGWVEFHNIVDGERFATDAVPAEPGSAAWVENGAATHGLRPEF